MSIDINKRTKGEWQQKESNNSFIVNDQDLIKQTIICSVYGSGEEAEANAAYIVTACNHFEAMLSYIKEMAKRYEKSEWISGEANKIIQSINKDIQTS